MTVTTTEQFADRGLQRLRVKLADRNVNDAVQEIGERVVSQAVEEHGLYDAERRAGVAVRIAAKQKPPLRMMASRCAFWITRNALRFVISDEHEQLATTVSKNLMPCSRNPGIHAYAIRTPFVLLVRVGWR